MERKTTASYWARLALLNCGGVLGRVDVEVVRRAEGLDRRDALVDRGVPEAGRLGEHEDVLERVGAGSSTVTEPDMAGVHVAEERVDARPVNV